MMVNTVILIVSILSVSKANFNKLE